MKSVVSIIDDLLEKYHNTKDHGSEELHDHIILAIDINDKGEPVAKVAKVQGKALGVLGMLELLQDQIDRLRTKVKEQFNDAEQKKAMMDTLPKDVVEKLHKLEESLKQRMKNGDKPTAEELEAIREEAKRIFDEHEETENDEIIPGKKNDGGFDINDFKSSF